MRTLIVVPARHGSTRFPGKPLALVSGHSLVSRVARRARMAAEALNDTDYVVATDDARIARHCEDLAINCVLTPADCETGSDRALAAAKVLGAEPEFVVNMQGDAPFVPVDYVTGTVAALAQGGADVATPCIRLSWDALDRLRLAKQATPFSGTTCLIDRSGMAIWFSKQILPAMRSEAALRAASPLSPVHRHVGLYGFTLGALKAFVATPPSPYEVLEGLEQLRLLENGLRVRCVEVAAAPVSTSGVDAPEDVTRLEALIREHGDPDASYFAP